MIKPEFVIGSEKKFFDFVGNIDKKDKVAIISHGEDIDGILSAKLMNEVFHGDLIKLMKYEELNDDLVEELKKNKITKITITDMDISDHEFIKKLEKFANILVIDHHLARKDFNSEKTTFLNCEGFCNSYICYYLLSKIQSVEKYDWLVVCTSFADWLYEKNKEWIKEVYSKYGLKFEDNIKKTELWEIQMKLNLATIYLYDTPMKVFDNFGNKYPDIGELKKYEEEIEREVKQNVQKFEKEKEIIGDVYFWEFSPKHKIASLLSNEVSNKNWNNTVIILTYAGDLFRVSARRQDQTVDCAAILRKLINGFNGSGAGGHKPAAGAFFLKKDHDEFVKRVRDHEF